MKILLFSAIHTRTDPKPASPAGSRKESLSQGSDPTKKKNCFRCGEDPQHDWKKGKCPALGSTYSYCKKANHWRAVCSRRIRMHKLEASCDDDVDSDIEFLDIHKA